MKITVAEKNVGGMAETGPLGWYLIADSALSNTGKPFYLPDSYGSTEVILTVAVRLSRLGKSVKRKFASRYYSEFAPALHFRLPQYARKLREMGLPQDASRSFDRALMAGTFRGIDEEEEFQLLINGEERARFSLKDLQRPVDEVIQQISVVNTVKMGDLLLPGLAEGLEIEQGDFLEVKSGDCPEFNVRVK